ncbi:MAG: isoleucine--tRNA ligase [Actinomycetales bacterium]|nr:isoleucine--tRNA ligase [Actinomycetales bacterium]
MTYPLSSASGAASVPANPSFPAIETGVLAFWKGDDTFRASVENRAGCPEWVFYDGPPFANGLPHYGHLLTGYAKDLFPRFQTMRGKQVHRRFGWDTHGLPAELEAMRQLGITTKDEIEAMGVAAFNAEARASVLRYTREWQDYVTRQARWVDFENDYKTLDVTFMESVIWAFKELHGKGLAYEGFRVLPYCWNDETPLSNHELRMDDDVYQQRQDQSVTVTFPLVGERAEVRGLTGVLALAWTTTPWTLPTNAALAVGPEIEYSVIPAGLAAADAELPQQFLLATDTIGSYLAELGYESVEAALAARVRTVTGAELADVHYDRLWDHYAEAEGMGDAWRVLVADYVATGEGTGIVHQAPAYGEDDQVTCAAAGIPVILSLDDGGRFLPSVPEVAGELWSDANSTLIKLLKANGRLFQQKSYLHSYPHCWRCRRPLIYKAVSSWFVRVTDYKPEMLELNEQITWVPENVKHGQFGKWLENARDWSISRNRFWGSPIPVWKSDDPAFPRVDVYGSLAELEADFGTLPRNAEGEVDLHRPFIDELTRPNPDDPSGRSTMRRIPDVLDVWFDSGSMPFAQVHYPFENKDWFDGTPGPDGEVQERHNPADFIVEYIGQTRGWFYTMHALATPLFGRPAYSSVLSHGIVLGNDGQKMSKSLRNYPDVSEVFDRDGSDAMRWFLMAGSVIRGGNLAVTEEGIRQGVREFLLPLWSSWYFFSLYANTATPGGYEALRRTDSPHLLDRYLLAKTRDLVEAVTGHLEALDSPLAAAELRDFADVLTNWYVRRSRDRFWAGERAAHDVAVVAGSEPAPGDWRDAFDTLFTVLETVCRVAAPLAPLVTEEIWKGLTGGRSVHLEDWPDAAEFPSDDALVAAMDRVREIASSALALRKARQLRVRLPLARLTVVADDRAALGEFTAILLEELNVKTVELPPLGESSLADFGITRRLSVNARAAGPRLGKGVQDAIRAAKAGDWTVDGEQVSVAGVPLEPGEYELVLESTDPDAAIAFLPGGGFVVLDAAVTPELEAEGLARDIVRVVQQARKDAGLDVGDRIALAIEGDAAALAAIGAHAGLIRSETLATSLETREGAPSDGTQVGAGSSVAVTVEKA